MEHRTLSVSRSQWLALAVAAALVVPGFFLAGPSDPAPGFSVALAASTPSGSSTTLRYQALISSGVRINPRDGFRIYDVPCYVAGSAEAPAGWTVTTELSDPEPASRVAPTRPDDPAVPNLVFTYECPAPVTGPTRLKGFSARSTSGDPKAVRSFTGRCSSVNGRDPTARLAASGDVHGPGAVPEPNSLVTACLGVIILGFVYAQSHRRMLGSPADGSAIHP